MIRDGPFRTACFNPHPFRARVAFASFFKRHLDDSPVTPVSRVTLPLVFETISAHYRARASTLM